jgi:hypothetical protein
MVLSGRRDQHLQQSCTLAIGQLGELLSPCRDRGMQFRTELHHVADLPVQPREFLDGQRMHLPARRSATVAYPQNARQFVQAEANCESAPHQPYAIHCFRRILPIAGGCPNRTR